MLQKSVPTPGINRSDLGNLCRCSKFCHSSIWCFSGNICRVHGGAECKGDHDWRFRTYVTLEWNELEHVVTLVYGTFFEPRARLYKLDPTEDVDKEEKQINRKNKMVMIVSRISGSLVVKVR